MKRPFVKHLENLIAEGETPAVLHVLLDFLLLKDATLSDSFSNFIAESDNNLRDACIIHQSALKKSDKDLQRGLINEEDHNQVVSRINYALLDAFSELESLEFGDTKALERAKTIENEAKEKENLVGNVGEIKKRKLMQNIAIGFGIVALLASLGWIFKGKFKKTDKASVVVDKPVVLVQESKKTRDDSLVIAEARYNEAVRVRALGKPDFVACIKECQEGLKWNSSSGKIYNQLAECYLYNDEITNAFSSAKKAFDCDSLDTNGYIMSTLAQIYGEMDNTKLFYFYTEEALKRDLPVWKYKEELGFSKYKDEPKFKVLMKKYNR